MSTTLKRILILAAVILVFILCLVFYLRNDDAVVLDYLLGTMELSFSAWLLILLAVGIVLGWLSLLPVILKLKADNARLNRQVKVSEKEINNLRVMPVKDAQ